MAEITRNDGEMFDVSEPDAQQAPSPEQIARERKVSWALDMFDGAMKQITASGANWMKHLDTAAAFHKYPFADQIMIGAQRPDATAVAELQTWNKSFGRKIKKGSKGVALLVAYRDGDEEKYRLRYVFDVKDTERTPWIKNAAYPRLWKFNEDRHGGAVLESLQREYGVNGATLEAQIAGTIADKLDEMKAEYDLSLSGNDDADFIQKSAEYVVCRRMGIDKDLSASDFEGVKQLDVESGYMAFVGDIINETSLEMLRVVERTVKVREQELLREERANNERSREDGNDRDKDEAGRGSDDTGSGGSRADEDREVRIDEGGVSGGAPSPDIHDAADDRSASQPLGGDERGGGDADGRADEGAPSEVPGPGQEGLDGVGSPHVDADGAGRGDDTERDSVREVRTGGQQTLDFGDFPTEEQQDQLIKETLTWANDKLERATPSLDEIVVPEGNPFAQKVSFIGGAVPIYGDDVNMFYRAREALQKATAIELLSARRDGRPLADRETFEKTLLDAVAKEVSTPLYTRVYAPLNAFERDTISKAAATVAAELPLLAEQFEDSRSFQDVEKGMRDVLVGMYDRGFEVRELPKRETTTQTIERDADGETRDSFTEIVDTIETMTASNMRMTDDDAFSKDEFKALIHENIRNAVPYLEANGGTTVTAAQLETLADIERSISDDIDDLRRWYAEITADGDREKMLDAIASIGGGRPTLDGKDDEEVGRLVADSIAEITMSNTLERLGYTSHDGRYMTFEDAQHQQTLKEQGMMATFENCREALHDIFVTELKRSAEHGREIDPADLRRSMELVVEIIQDERTRIEAPYEHLAAQLTDMTDLMVGHLPEIQRRLDEYSLTSQEEIDEREARGDVRGAAAGRSDNGAFDKAVEDEFDLIRSAVAGHGPALGVAQRTPDERYAQLVDDRLGIEAPDQAEAKDPLPRLEIPETPELDALVREMRHDVDIYHAEMDSRDDDRDTSEYVENEVKAQILEEVILGVQSMKRDAASANDVQFHRYMNDLRTSPYERIDEAVREEHISREDGEYLSRQIKAVETKTWETLYPVLGRAEERVLTMLENDVTEWESPLGRHVVKPLQRLMNTPAERPDVPEIFEHYDSSTLEERLGRAARIALDYADAVVEHGKADDYRAREALHAELESAVLRPTDEYDRERDMVVNVEASYDDRVKILQAVRSYMNDGIGKTIESARRGFWERDELSPQANIAIEMMKGYDGHQIDREYVLGELARSAAYEIRHAYAEGRPVDYAAFDKQTSDLVSSYPVRTSAKISKQDMAHLKYTRGLIANTIDQIHDEFARRTDAERARREPSSDDIYDYSLELARIRVGEASREAYILLAPDRIQKIPMPPTPALDDVETLIKEEIRYFADTPDGYSTPSIEANIDLRQELLTAITDIKRNAVNGHREAYHAGMEELVLGLSQRPAQERQDYGTLSEDDVDRLQGLVMSVSEAALKDLPPALEASEAKIRDFRERNVPEWVTPNEVHRTMPLDGWHRDSRLFEVGTKVSHFIWEVQTGRTSIDDVEARSALSVEMFASAEAPLLFKHGSRQPSILSEEHFVTAEISHEELTYLTAAMTDFVQNKLDDKVRDVLVHWQSYDHPADISTEIAEDLSASFAEIRERAREEERERLENEEAFDIPPIGYQIAEDIGAIIGSYDEFREFMREHAEDKDLAYQLELKFAHEIPEILENYMSGMLEPDDPVGYNMPDEVWDFVNAYRSGEDNTAEVFRLAVMHEAQTYAQELERERAKRTILPPLDAPQTDALVAELNAEAQGLRAEADEAFERFKENYPDYGTMSYTGPTYPGSPKSRSAGELERIAHELEQIKKYAADGDRKTVQYTLDNIFNGSVFKEMSEAQGRAARVLNDELLPMAAERNAQRHDLLRSGVTEWETPQAIHRVIPLEGVRQTEFLARMASAMIRGGRDNFESLMRDEVIAPTTEHSEDGKHVVGEMSPDDRARLDEVISDLCVDSDLRETIFERLEALQFEDEQIDLLVGEFQGLLDIQTIMAERDHGEPEIQQSSEDTIKRIAFPQIKVPSFDTWLDAKLNADSPESQLVRTMLDEHNGDFDAVAHAIDMQLRTAEQSAPVLEAASSLMDEIQNDRKKIASIFDSYKASDDKQVFVGEYQADLAYDYEVDSADMSPDEAKELLDQLTRYQRYIRDIDEYMREREAAEAARDHDEPEQNIAPSEDEIAPDDPVIAAETPPPKVTSWQSYVNKNDTTDLLLVARDAENNVIYARRFEFANGDPEEVRHHGQMIGHFGYLDGAISRGEALPDHIAKRDEKDALKDALESLDKDYALVWSNDSPESHRDRWAYEVARAEAITRTREAEQRQRENDERDDDAPAPEPPSPRPKSPSSPSGASAQRSIFDDSDLGYEKDPTSTTGAPIRKGLLSEMLGIRREPKPILDANGNEIKLKQVVYELTDRGYRRVGEPQTKREPEPQPKAHNFTITDDELGEYGEATRYKNNVAAIRTLKEIEDRGTPATLEEQEVMSRYTGWGALSETFNEDKEQYASRREELHEILNDAEYRAAMASTINAHYTSPLVIDSIYETLGRMNLNGGNILEPSMGVGNFFGKMPESLRENANLFGVELDSITGRIATQLYPSANIQVAGFEKTKFNDNAFDAVIGNVPFSEISPNDPAYNDQKLPLHDYFFAKSLDKVRPGGVVAFVTSKGTLDKADPTFREKLAQQADLLGAVRLPAGTFGKNAGTQVTADILFLQKRETRDVNHRPSWVDLSMDKNGVPINSYFVDNPEMVLGTMVQGKSLYGNDTETRCDPFEGADLKELLHNAMLNIEGDIIERAPSIDLDDEAGSDRETIPADPRVRNFSYCLKDGELYYREDSVMYQPQKSATERDRLIGLVKLRDCAQSLVDFQTLGYSDEMISNKQAELHEVYDDFVSKYGRTNDRANLRAMRDDSSYFLLSALEDLDSEKNFVGKADIFSKRTIEIPTPVDHVETPGEALVLSIAERAKVDLDYMSQLTGIEQDQLIKDLEGVIFRNPEVPADSTDRPLYETAEEYLSGNVRRKLAVAREMAELDSTLEPNVRALEEAQPIDLTAAEIDAPLSATWIPPEIIKDFIDETFEPPHWVSRSMTVSYAECSATWNISNKNADSNSILATATYGTEYANAYKLLEDALNMKDTKVYETVYVNGEEKRVVDHEKTIVAQQKQQGIKDKFEDWVYQDPERRAELVKIYNEKFNSDRVRTYDGSHLRMAGKNPEIVLRKHQLDAIAHIIHGGNTLLAHEVGAGKTFEMIGAMMEMNASIDPIRLFGKGLCGFAQKSLVGFQVSF